VAARYWSRLISPETNRFRCGCQGGPSARSSIRANTASTFCSVCSKDRNALPKRSFTRRITAPRSVVTSSKAPTTNPERKGRIRS
jgi:hypothetical protein